MYFWTTSLWTCKTSSEYVLYTVFGRRVAIFKDRVLYISFFRCTFITSVKKRNRDKALYNYMIPQNTYQTLTSVSTGTDFIRTHIHCNYTNIVLKWSFFYRHNDLPWNIRKFLRNQINEFELDTDLTVVEPWSISKYSHTDLPRLREGMVGAQVR